MKPLCIRISLNIFQEGLLYGNITQITSDRITDNDADGNHHEVEFGKQLAAHNFAPLASRV